MTLDVRTIQVRLEAERFALQKEILRLIASSPSLAETLFWTDEASAGHEATTEVAVESQQVRAMLAHQQALLITIKEALGHIERGTYGRCIDCGQPIPEQRLQAIPWAQRDIGCEEAREQEQLSRREVLVGMD